MMLRFELQSALTWRQPLLSASHPCTRGPANLEATAPRMLFWSGFGVRSQKMMENMKEHQNMLFVTPRLSYADVIGNHVTNSNQAVLVLMREIGGKRGCGDLRKMLVFCNSEHFLFGEAA
jgi:hypothetical protein